MCVRGGGPLFRELSENVENTWQFFSTSDSSLPLPDIAVQCWELTLHTGPPRTTATTICVHRLRLYGGGASAATLCDALAQDGGASRAAALHVTADDAATAVARLVLGHEGKSHRTNGQYLDRTDWQLPGRGCRAAGGPPRGFAPADRPRWRPLPDFTPQHAAAPGR